MASCMAIIDEHPTSTFDGLPLLLSNTSLSESPTDIWDRRRSISQPEPTTVSPGTQQRLLIDGQPYFFPSRLCSNVPRFRSSSIQPVAVQRRSTFPVERIPKRVNGLTPLDLKRARSTCPDWAPVGQIAAFEKTNQDDAESIVTAIQEVIVEENIVKEENEMALDIESRTPTLEYVPSTIALQRISWDMASSEQPVITSPLNRNMTAITVATNNTTKVSLLSRMTTRATTIFPFLSHAASSSVRKRQKRKVEDTRITLDPQSLKNKSSSNFSLSRLDTNGPSGPPCTPARSRSPKPSSVTSSIDSGYSNLSRRHGVSSTLFNQPWLNPDLHSDSREVSPHTHVSGPTPFFPASQPRPLTPVETEALEEAEDAAEVAANGRIQDWYDAHRAIFNEREQLSIRKTTEAHNDVRHALDAMIDRDYAPGGQRNRSRLRRWFRPRALRRQRDNERRSRIAALEVDIQEIEGTAAEIRKGYRIYCKFDVDMDCQPNVRRTFRSIDWGNNGGSTGT